MLHHTTTAIEQNTPSYSIGLLLPTESTLQDLPALPDERKLMHFTLPTWQCDNVWTQV